MVCAGEDQVSQAQLLDVTEFVEFRCFQQIFAAAFDLEDAMNRVIDHLRQVPTSL
jgi:hypothetical protein